ncbi:hypothetical protein [Aeromonas hydrophila]|uniref:hypothetical protein n=1 Tax=Aeromonas hydrophila TaxID=644 RepID=UPI003EC8658C
MKFIVLISFFFITSYALYPFVNGMGCDFRSQVDADDSVLYSTCKLGWVTTVAKNKKTNEVLKYSGIYGKNGSSIFFFALEIEEINTKVDVDSHPVDFFHSESIYLAKVVPGDEHDWILLGYPFSRVHSMIQVGRSAFF